jgi:bacterioferritin-associated ferredoxin
MTHPRENDRNDLDREVCLCFHVTLRKLKQHLRVAKPQFASQLSECFGAGTGCGWCRPFLRKLHESGTASPASPILPDADSYQSARGEYLSRTAKDRANADSGSGREPTADNADSGSSE